MEKTASKGTVKIELTPEQREQIKRATGKEVSEVELTPQALEERIAPTRYTVGGC
jgi:hypothetical protein